MKILLLEDDAQIAQNVATLLEKQGYVTEISGTLKSAEEKVVSNEYDCIIIDRGLPDGDGLQLLRTLNEDQIKSPVLVLTAKNNPDQKVEGLDKGADDYLTKPFHMEELLARVRVLLRRGVTHNEGSVLKARDLVMDTSKGCVHRAGKEINLSPKEYSMLQYLMVNKCKTVDRMTLLTHVWDEQVDLFSNTVDVHIRYLRKKIDDGYFDKIIRTVRGKGYIICEE